MDPNQNRMLHEQQTNTPSSIPPYTPPKKSRPFFSFVLLAIAVVLILFAWFIIIKKNSPPSVSNTQPSVTPVSAVTRTEFGINLEKIVLPSSQNIGSSSAKIFIDTHGNPVHAASIVVNFDPNFISNITIDPLTQTPQVLYAGAKLNQLTHLAQFTILAISQKEDYNGNFLVAELHFSLGNTQLSQQTTSLSIDKSSSAYSSVARNSEVSKFDSVTIPLSSLAVIISLSPSPTKEMFQQSISCPVGTNNYQCSNLECIQSQTPKSNLYCQSRNMPFCCQNSLSQSLDETDRTCQEKGGVCAPAGSVCGDKGQISTCSNNRPCCRNSILPTPTPASLELSQFYCSQQDLGYGPASCKSSCNPGKEEQVSTCAGNLPCCVPNTSDTFCKTPNYYCIVGNTQDLNSLSSNPLNNAAKNDSCLISGVIYPCYPQASNEQ